MDSSKVREYRNHVGVMVPHWVPKLDITDAALRYYLGIADLVGGVPLEDVAEKDAPLVLELLRSGAVHVEEGVLVAPWTKP